MKATIKALSKALRALKSFRRVTTPAEEKHWVTLCVEKGESIFTRKEGK